MNGEHHYSSRLAWEGNLGTGTSTYQAYSRQWRFSMEGKPDIVGTSDPAFRGVTDRHNPEDLLLAALSSCHMLSFLALCALGGISVLSYRDEASGTMVTTPGGGGHFTEVTLRPVVEIAQGERLETARRLHEKAHDGCFIAASVNFPVSHQAVVTARGIPAAAG
jgi:organic hydroperoxide reductase OsmC/OhrA